MVAGKTKEVNNNNIYHVIITTTVMEIGEKRKRDSTSTTNDHEDEKTASKVSKTVNETVIPFEFIECECEYTIKASDKVIKMPADFMRLACRNLSDLPKEIDLSTITARNITDALTFYIPRSNRYSNISLQTNIQCS